MQESSENMAVRANRNPVAFALCMTAYAVYMVGFCLGCAIGSGVGDWAESVSTGVWTMLLCWFATFVIGTLIIGLSEIIELLQAIKDK